MNKKENTAGKIRFWLLYVIVAVLMASIATLGFRIIGSIIDIEKNSVGDCAGDCADNESTMIEGDASYANLERRHKFSEHWMGNQHGGVVEWVVNDVITHNKKYSDEPIQMVFGNTDCRVDVDCMAREKNKLSNTNVYDILYEYGKDGYVYLVRVNNIKGDNDWMSDNLLNYILIVFIAIVAVVILLIVGGIMRRRKIDKIIKDQMENHY